MRRILWIALANAAGALQYYLVGYVASSFIQQYLSNTANGMIFSAAALLMMGGFLVAPFVFQRISVRRAGVLLSLADIAALFALSFKLPSFAAIILITIQMALAPLIWYTLDLFLENATLDEGRTGHMRGLFLTSGNVALVAAPVLIGFVLGTTNAYGRIFFAAAISMLVFVGILVTRQRFLADEKIIDPGSLWQTLIRLLRNPEIRSVLIANTLLQSFYIWAPVYVPLYLHAELGIPWSALGPIFALMLLPFLLIELPMGFLEDKFRGARAVMATGFAITGASLASFAFITASTSLAVIATVLIFTRIGAALIEITAETSFFRDVGGQDAESVSFFRMTRPLGMLIGPIFGSFFLLFVTLQAVFIPLGILCFFGIPFALRIKDGAQRASA